MTPERYKRLGQLYHAALEVQPESLAVFLNEACGSDEELRREVELLLAAHIRVGNYFAAPALEVAAGLVNKHEKPSLSGKRFAHYGGLSFIGVGGMGDVYLGEDRRLGRKVALKILPKKFTQDQERVRRFEQEARLASALNHPNVVTIYEVGQVDGRHFIATEYIEGQTLRERLSEGTITVREAVEVGAQMASALAAAHEAGIIHRDIKPENVMLRRDGLVKVLDFGLAKLTENQGNRSGTYLTNEMDTDTSPGLVLGTLSYMSPEQARGERLDERTDIFSLGVVLYEMVAGQSPFAAPSGAETLVAILEREPKALTLYVQNLPVEIEQMVEKALRKKREDRYQRASDLAIDLKSLNQEIQVARRLKRTTELESEGKSVRTSGGSQASVATLEHNAVRTDDVAATMTTSSTEHLVGEVKRRKNAALSATLGIFLSGAAFIFWGLSSDSDNNPDNAPGKSPLALRIEKLTETGLSRIVAISPDGKYVAYTHWVGDKMSIWLRQLATNTNLEIVPPAGPVGGMMFAHNGEQLYFARAIPPALYRVSLLGGSPTKLVDTPQGKFSISHDDKQIAFIREVINHAGQREFSLIVADSNGSNERTLLMGTYPDKLDAPVWAPDGQSIICSYGASQSGAEEVSLLEVKLDGGEKRELSAERFDHIAKIAWLPDRSAMVVSGRKSAIDNNNQLWRVSYPGMEVSQLTDGPLHFLDLSFSANADKAVASTTTRIQDIWVSSDRNPQNLRKITPATRHFCWTPDGRLIYSSKASGNLDLWEMWPDGTGQRQLTAEAAVDYLPAITPDNRYIVFISNRSGAFQVWRMNRDGSNQIQLTAGSSHTNPAVSPNGKWVLFNSTADWHMWKVPIEGGGAVRLTSYVAYSPSVSPDGRFVASVGRRGTKRELLILSLHGGQPLKRFEFAEWAPGLRWASDGKALIYSAERGARMSLIRQPVDGRPPTEIARLDYDATQSLGRSELFDFGYSFDNRLLAVTQGTWQHDVVLISGFARP